MLLVLMVLAKLEGEDKPSRIAEWIEHRKAQLIEMGVLPRERAPSHMTYRRVLQEVIDPQEFEQAMSQFHRSRLKKGQEVVFSMDGKTLRGTIPAPVSASPKSLGLNLSDVPALNAVSDSYTPVASDRHNLTANERLISGYPPDNRAHPARHHPPHAILGKVCLGG
jgi:hypothetical protein